MASIAVASLVAELFKVLISLYKLVDLPRHDVDTKGCKIKYGICVQIPSLQG